MGAYYEATIEDNRYNTHAIGSGLKLMEHSYLPNEYCKSIEYLLLNKPQPLVWLCDYHKADSTTEKTWSNTNELIDGFETPEEYITNDSNKFFVNHSKKVFISTHELIELYDKINTGGWYVHPLPLLCNSNKKSMGGGDMHKDFDLRSSWCGDNISVELNRDDFNSDFKNVTDKCVFNEE